MHIDKQTMTPIRHLPNDPQLAELLSLIQTNYAFMDSRINPPSSMYQLSVDAISAQCDSGEVWSIGQPPIACVFLNIVPSALYLGKLCVAEGHRGAGLARRLVDLAEERARELGLMWLELETRIELVENHQTFAKLGFSKTGEGSHPGFEQPTYIIMRKSI